ncbi:MAG TPA: M61 family peptidase [Verrucomicrobiae bacterium]|nr:M61 family peptidase [Verrucomicrobiae bacterium]
MRFATFVCLALWAPLHAQTQVKLRVDATDATRRLFHVRMSMPAKSGPMTLLYPQWIPGEHSPTGPIANLVGLKVQGGGKTIAWKRDSVNMFAFHLDVPAGVTSLDVAFDFISPPDAEGFSSGASTTTELAVLNWNQLLLYPQGAQADDLQYQATLRVPAGWRYGTALPIQRESGNEIEFQPASLTTMVDSPVSAGAHYKTFDLGTDGGIPHYLHVAADSDRALEAPNEVVEHFRSLVKETGALFGARHYRSYHFLYTLSDHVAHFGLEHHESSDDRTAERSLIDPDILRSTGYLLPHEMAHSWNGKYRRPAGLTANGHDGGYDVPMKGDLLWVYEGLTNYLGEILASRSGLWSPEEYRESLASTAAELDNKAGRTWRPLEDTAVAAQILYESGDDYASLRRSVDYYPEGSLVWLEADVLIRQLSKGARSLDDFCHTFHGGASGKIEMKTYELADVVAGLNAVQPYDWSGFLDQRLHSTVAHAPLGGVTGSGWKLVYDGVRSDFWRASEDKRKLTDMSYSIGIQVREDGGISDVLYGGPAQKAGVTPSVKLIAVNGRQFNPTVLREAVAAAKPVELLVKDGEFYKAYRIEYTGGEKYPHLVRDESRPDLLTAIIASKTRR